VETGLAITEDELTLDKPIVGDHRYVYPGVPPVEVETRFTDAPAHIVKFPLVIVAMEGGDVMLNALVSRQPFVMSLTIT
jgi:hypothetical protein